MKRLPGGVLKAFAVRFGGMLWIAARSIFDEQLMLRTMSLVYTTLLSLIPLLAVSFSLVKAFGVHTRMEGVIANALAPMGPAGEDLARRVITTVEEVDLGVLGAVGFIFLLYKALFLIYKIERALNHIWQVESTRRMLRRFGDYTIVLLVGPVLLLTAAGITFSLMSTTLVQRLLSIRLLGPLVDAAGALVPYGIVVAVFTFIYMFLPDTKVRFGSALIGGILAGIGWEAAGWIFATFTISSAEYSAVYSGFAIPILFLMWLYMSWFILLIGARIAFYHQNFWQNFRQNFGQDFLRHPRLVAAPQDTLSRCRATERLSLSVMSFIGEQFYHKKTPWRLDALAKRLEVPAGSVQEVLGRLERKGIIAATRDKPPAYLPARAIETITLQEILEAEEPGTGDGYGGAASAPHEVDVLLDRIDHARARSLEGRTLRDLVLAGTEEKQGETIPG